MAALEIPAWVVVLSLTGVALGIVYFLWRGLKSDHETGEYHFTWAVGVVVLFVLGFAPGLVGIGLYLTVERGYPSYWLIGFVLAALVVLIALGASTDGSVTVAELAAAPAF